jgi:hypothetical protein
MEKFNNESDDKFKKYEGHGISAPQVLRFLDSISGFLKGMTTDIDRALDEIQTNFDKVPDEETTDAKDDSVVSSIDME